MRKQIQNVELCTSQMSALFKKKNHEDSQRFKRDYEFNINLDWIWIGGGGMGRVKSFKKNGGSWEISM